MANIYNTTGLDGGWLRSALLYVVIALFSFSAAAPAQTSTPQTSKILELQLELTPEEQAWLAEHPEIVLGTTTDYPPMVIKRSDGTYVGALVDIFTQLSLILNIRIRLHIDDSWPDIQEKAQNREIDGLAMGGRDPSRDALYNATDTLLPTYFSVFARSQSEFRLKRFSDLKGLRVGYKSGARPTRSLLEKLPSISIKPYKDHESLTQALLGKEIDVIVAWMSYDHWRKEKLQGTIDNILLIDEYPIEMVSYIRKDWPELPPIFNKALAVLQQNDLPFVIEKWFGQWPHQSQSVDEAEKILNTNLTDQERAWLAQNRTVRVRIVDWPPYMILNGNEPPQGIAVEYLKVLEKRTGITFKYEVTEQPFAEFLESMKRRQGPDMAVVIVPTPEREQYMSFTENYVSSPYVIFIPAHNKPILDITDLAGKSLAVLRGAVLHEQLAREYPEIRLVLFNSDEEALRAVATGQADAYIGNLTVASHIIHRRGFSSLRVAAATPLDDHSLAMGTRNDWPELTSIINKALESISEEEKTGIRTKYLAIKFEQGMKRAELFKWSVIIGGLGGGIVLIFIFWNRLLRLEISKRKQTETDLRMARDEANAANQAKSIFLANISHELRTPLNAILGFSGILAREVDFSTGQQEKLGIIKRSGEHLLCMINDVLDLSKIESGRMELEMDEVDLLLMLEDIGRIFELRTKKAGLRFDLELNADLPRYIRTDIGKLRQILINLMDNAVKYTREGVVSLRARTLPLTESPATVILQLAIEDSGPGIAQEQIGQIFEPFVQLQQTQNSRKGTGLGLTISMSFAQALGGEINVTSKIGVGALFRVDLPVALTETADSVGYTSDRRTVVGLEPGQAAWRILVVEDNPDNRLLLCNLLRQVGFDIREAENGEQAVAVFEQWQPHFIWMDMRMPVMDGYAATKKIRALQGGREVKIVAVTAHVFKKHGEEILDAGCDGLVHKPFQEHEIFDIMARHLKVSYLHGNESEDPHPEETPELTAEMLAELPEELLNELDRATLTLNRETVFAVIERITPLAPATARGLQLLMDKFQIGRIGDLIEAVKKRRK